MRVYNARRKEIGRAGHHAKELPASTGKLKQVSITAALRLSGERGRNRTYNLLIPSQQLNTNGFNDFPKF